MTEGGRGFVAVWEFRIPPGSEGEFERAYGPEGPWVRLFASDPAYRGTKLVKDVNDPQRYLTIDSWASAEAYDGFKGTHAAEYDEIDCQCQSLTEGEREIGRFVGVERP